MMTVTARSSLRIPGFTGREDGVALLQVLLLSALLSLIAIRFSATAQDQIGMASDLEARVKAQMAAHSTFNQVIFSELSESVVAKVTTLDRALFLVMGVPGCFEGALD